MGLEIEASHASFGHVAEYSNEYFYHHQLIHRIRDHLLTYRHSWLERGNCEKGDPITRICWADRPPYDVFWADHLNVGINDFADLFFSDFQEFYRIPEAQRDQYIVQALEVWDGLFDSVSHEIWDPADFISAANEFYKKLVALKKSTQI